MTLSARGCWLFGLAWLPLLTPLGAADGTLINLSARLALPPQQAVVTAGFVIQGTATQPVLIRASGPTLATFGIAGTAAHPVMTLFGSNGVVASNTAWDTGGGAAVTQADLTTGAFTLLPTTAAASDSALVANLPPGNYSVQVSDNSGAGGIALIEVYTVGSTASRLVNLSVRSLVGTGNAVLTAGFVIQGGPCYVLSRGVGPSLASFGVTDGIGHPVLTLFNDGESILATNSDWTKAPLDIAYDSTLVGAFALGTGNMDAAQLISLAAGSYSVQVTDTQNQAGEALVELYESPNGLAYPNSLDVAGIAAARQLITSSYRSFTTATGPVQLTVAPIDPAQLSVIIPLGLMVGSHVTPVDHIYYYGKDLVEQPNMYQVRAAAAGTIVAIEERPSDGTGTLGQEIGYQLLIQHSQTFYSYVDLMDSLDPAILAAVPAGTFSKDQFVDIPVDIPVTAGQNIGKVGARSLDFGVYDLQQPLAGFVVPAHYSGESLKLFVSDPFNCFAEPVRSQLLALNPRIGPPFGGKLDYDVAGALNGNWFQQGANGYDTPPPGVPAPPTQNWWHLAVAYYNLDPSLMEISIGNYNGTASQFFVNGNGPLPETVTQATGVVAYELIAVPGQPVHGPFFPIFRPGSTPPVVGVVLFQVLLNNQLKVQIFPNKTAAQVSGFTADALIYTR